MACWTKWVLLSAAGVLLCGQTLLAAESESQPSEAVGAHVFTFRPGWNLISFPIMDENSTFEELFFDILEGYGSPEGSDLIKGINPETGVMDSLWIDHGYLPVGGLAEVVPSPEAAYWLYRNPDFVENARLVQIGRPRTDASINRGSFEPGSHLVGSYYADVVPFSESGLEEAGIEHSPGILGPAGDGLEGVLGWDNLAQRYRMAFFDGERWRGDLPAMKAGHGYLLWNRHQINWEQFADPSQAHLEVTSLVSPTISPVKRVHKIEGRGK